MISGLDSVFVVQDGALSQVRPYVRLLLGPSLPGVLVQIPESTQVNSLVCFDLLEGTRSEAIQSILHLEKVLYDTRPPSKSFSVHRFPTKVLSK